MTTKTEILTAIARLFLKHNEPLMQAYIFQQINKIHGKNLNKRQQKRLRDRVNHYLKWLEKNKIIQRVNTKSRFVAFKTQDTRFFIDLININARPKPPAEPPNPQKNQPTKELSNETRNYELLPRFKTYSQEWIISARELIPRPPKHFTDYQKEKLAMHFLTWKEQTEERKLLFKTHDDQIELKDYKTRFNNKFRAFNIIKTYDHAMKEGREKYGYGVFITITMQPNLPLRIQQMALSFILHRIKALVRKQQGETLPHICTNEPQANLSAHKHVVIFGTKWLMPKRQLTKYLDKHLKEFLRNMGEHYKRTINKRATEDQVSAYNKLGKKFLKKYLKYKERKNRKLRAKGKKEQFEGVINFITKIELKGSSFSFHNPPPDVIKFSEKSENKQFNITVEDYLKKYMIKNVFDIIEDPEEDDINKIIKIAWYWLLRIPFFTCSPSLRPQKEKPPPAGWTFIGSFTEDQIHHIMENYSFGQLETPVKVIPITA